jgi:uroporphyrinogen decarboxylase
MTPKEILKNKLAGEKTERELFCPAIYEHKAKLIGKAISEVATDAKLLEEALVAEYETYQPDMLTVGIDIYNVEAEALGAEVVFPDSAESVPSVKAKILDDISKVDQLEMPDLSTAGRIPMLLEVTKNINDRFGKDLLVRGALSGPYSIAAELMGIEPLIMALMLDEENCCKLMDFTTSFAIAYGKEYIKRGVSVCMFDSQASPPLISPDMFEKILLPRYQRIAAEFKAAECECSELVIGGQTDSIAQFMLDTGFDIVLSDFTSDANCYFDKKDRTLPLVRRNISPALVENSDFEALQEKVDEIKQLAGDFNNVIIGTGVLSYNTPIENIRKLKMMCRPCS